MRIIEDALNEGIGSILILEDDATFCEGFASKALEYLSRLPSGWGQAYLGGQHLGRPEPHSPGIVVPRNVNRTHAYALQGAEAMADIYKWLNAADHWINRNHIDHHYGRLHKQKKIAVFAPEEWLCGQASDRSDISCKEVPERWWNVRNEPARKFVAVVGLHRSGSSCVAMILHKLGVNMGDKLIGYESRNGGGGEAAGLAHLCERASRFPAVGIKDAKAAARELSAWIRNRMKKHPVSGAKYPLLCALTKPLVETCGASLRVIHCDRPLEESIDSLKRRSRKSSGWLAATDADCEAVQRWLWEEKTAFLGSREHHNVEYHRLRSDPAEVVDGLIKFLGLIPTSEQRQDAISHVRAAEAELCG